MPKKGFGSRERAEEGAQKMNDALGKFGVEYGVRGHTDPATGEHRDDVVARKPKRRGK